MGVAFYIDGWFFCFEKKLPSVTYSKAVIGGLSRATDFYGIFVYDILVSRGVTSSIGYVPAKSFKKWVYKFTAKLSFVVSLVFVGFDVAVECFDKLYNSGGYISHLFLSPLQSLKNGCVKNSTKPIQ